MVNEANNIFIIGIKGAAMANLALVLKKMAKKVTGADLEEEYPTDELLSQNSISFQKDFTRLPKDVDLVIYSAAHGGSNNPLAVEAKRRGVRVVSQAEVLNELMKGFENRLAVCGCHGKTTTASLLAYALKKLGAKPSHIIGTSTFNGYPGGDYQERKYFVVEADEYGVNPPDNITPKFHYLTPDYIVATNIDYDHPDVYKDLIEVKKAYLEFFNQVQDDGKVRLFVCCDDPVLMDVVKSSKRQYQTFGFKNDADLRITSVSSDGDGTTFTLAYKNQDLGNYETALFGNKNVSNAAGVILVLLNLGFKADNIRTAVMDFHGAKRRLEKIHQIKETYLFDDYAHHPNEIKATVNALRERFKNKRLILVFQPHTFSRTSSLFQEFALSLSMADLSYVMPIYASARENPDLFKVTSADIERADASGKTKAVASKEDLVNNLKGLLKENDVVVTMGAGDVYKLKDDIIDLMGKVVG
jgi:UDP-N-acetylmuramate--alanine ligase